MPDDSGLTLAEAARAIGIAPETVERLGGIVRPFAAVNGALILRQILGLQTLALLPGLEIGDAAVIAAEASKQARLNGNRAMAIRWRADCTPAWTWLTEDPDISRLPGPVLLLPADHMLSGLALRCDQIRAQTTRLN